MTFDRFPLYPELSGASKRSLYLAFLTYESLDYKLIIISQFFFSISDGSSILNVWSISAGTVMQTIKMAADMICLDWLDSWNFASLTEGSFVSNVQSRAEVFRQNLKWL